MWPPLDPGRPISETEAILESHSRLTAKRWKELNRLVMGSEREIQDTILKLAAGELKGDGILSLEGYLKKSWEMARDLYNEEHVREPGPMESDFYLDPDGAIATVHSSDLEIFALDFLRDMEAPLLHNMHRPYPVYRNGANYQDHSEAVQNVILFKPSGWSEMEEPKQINGPITFNKNVREHLRRVRANFLVPHINITDLLNPQNLLSFIHHRARRAPSEFATIDNDLCYLGRQTQILSGVFDPGADISFSHTQLGGDDPNLGLRFWYKKDTLGRQSTQDEHLGHSRGLQEALIFATMEAWLIMQSQAVTFAFLSSLCRQMVSLARGEECPDPPPEPTQDEKDAIETAAIRKLAEVIGSQGPAGWQDLHLRRQYEPMVMSADVERYLQSVQSKTDRAEYHIRRLFDDPEYFCQHVLEQKEHHWANLRVNYEDDRNVHIERYHDHTYRHLLYRDCLRSVLRRAVFDCFMWDVVDKKLREVVQEDAKVPPLDRDARLEADENTGGAKVWSHAKWSSYPQGSDEWNELRFVNMAIQVVIRYCAAYFVLEFRNKAIHAASEPMRDIYSLLDPRKASKANMAGNIGKGHYSFGSLKLALSRKTVDSDRDDLCRSVAELIENFIANETSCMHVGMRKITERLQMYLDDCDDEDTSNVFTNLISDTIDSLDLLSAIAEHLDLHLPVAAIHGMGSEEREALISAGLEQTSINFEVFDEFVFEDCVPDKRMARISKLLDEIQGFNTPSMNYGQARGDLKRLGSSLLHNLIVPTNARARLMEVVWDSTFTKGADNKAIANLEARMGVRNNQYPFHPQETPMDMDAIEDIVGRELPDRWRGIAARVNEEAEIRKKEKQKKKKQKQKQKGSGSNKREESDPVANIQKREAMLKARVEDQRARWHRRQARRKEAWRHGGANTAGKPVSPSPEPDDDAAPSPEQSVSSEEGPASAPESEASVGRVAAGVQHLDLQPQQRPQQQLPLPPVPPTRTLPPRPQPVLAPDGLPVDQLNKAAWTTWRSILHTNDKKLTWGDVVRAMNAIGYQDEGRGGSHGVFLRTDACRWRKDDLPKGKTLHVARHHGGSKQGAAPRGKAQNWGNMLMFRGLTWDFFKRWYRQKM
ncbi:hypothetical protein ACJ41O_000932 [Fusarium nematophilum]